MTTITSGRDIVAMAPSPSHKSHVNWARIGFLSLNLIAWVGIVAAARALA